MLKPFRILANRFVFHPNQILNVKMAICGLRGKLNIVSLVFSYLGFKKATFLGDFWNNTQNGNIELLFFSMFVCLSEQFFPSLMP